MARLERFVGPDGQSRFGDYDLQWIFNCRDWDGEQESVMGHRLTLELPDDVFALVADAAAKSGETPEQWIHSQLAAWGPKSVISESERAAAMQRLMCHAGAVDLGRPTGTDNIDVDRDLGAEFDRNHLRAP